MKESFFKKMKDGIPKMPKVGDLFLDGELSKQKYTKKKGDIISFYRIISVKEGKFEYIPLYKKLE